MKHTKTVKASKDMFDGLNVGESLFVASGDARRIARLMLTHQRRFSKKFHMTVHRGFFFTGPGIKGISLERIA